MVFPTHDDQRFQAIEQQLFSLIRRVEALEARQPDLTAVPPQQLPSTPGEDKVIGTLSYHGILQMGDDVCEWDRDHAVHKLVDLEQIAQILSALSYPVRLQLVRLLLFRSCSSQQLQSDLGIESGTLYHHLKPLLALGIATQPSRSAYQIAPHRLESGPLDFLASSLPHDTVSLSSTLQFLFPPPFGCAVLCPGSQFCHRYFARPPSRETSAGLPQISCLYSRVA